MEAYKREFIDFLKSANVLKFGDFTAKSGRKIPYFINAGEIKTGEQISKLGEFYAKAYFEKIGNIRSGPRGGTRTAERRLIPSAMSIERSTACALPLPSGTYALLSLRRPCRQLRLPH